MFVGSTMARRFKDEIYTLVLLLIVEKSLASDQKGYLDCSLKQELYSKCQAPCVKQVNQYTIEVFFGSLTFFSPCFEDFGINYWNVDSGREYNRYRTRQRGQRSMRFELQQNVTYKFQVKGRNMICKECGGDFYSFETTTMITNVIPNGGSKTCPPNPRKLAITRHNGDIYCASSEYGTRQTVGKQLVHML